MITMQVDKALAFNFNRLSLPRLLQEEVEADLNMIPMRKTADGNVLVRFSDVSDVSSRFGIGIREAFDVLKEDHAIKQPMYAVVLEARLYEDYQYQRAILEEGWDIPILIKTAGTDEQFDEILMECVEDGLYYGNTEKLEILCELFSNLFGLIGGNAGVDYHDIGAAVDNAKQRGGKWLKGHVDRIIQHVGGKLANGAMNKVEERLGNADGMINKAGSVAEKVAGKVVEKGAGAVRAKMWPYVRNALLIGGGAAITGVIKNQFDNLTNQEAIANAQPGVAAKMMNSLKNLLGVLTNKQQQAAGNPQQQGIISRMIAKIKNAIHALARKVGLAH